MNTCPMFGKCGGCKFDFTSDSYKDEKMALLNNVHVTAFPVWINPGNRRRAEFAFCEGKFGFYQARTKNIVQIKNCPLLTDELNAIAGQVSKFPFTGSCSVLITVCDNGIDIAFDSIIKHCSGELKKAAQEIDAIRITWNGDVIKQTMQPVIKFGDKFVDYPVRAFLQPSVAGEQVLREMVIDASNGCKKVVDLFCGLGSFTFCLNAIGYDISGLGSSRDLFKKPLKTSELNKYDCVVMDPPRGGAGAQVKQLVKSDVKKVIYVSCGITSFTNDKKVLENGGFKLQSLTPIDQFVGAEGWELVGVFEKIKI